METPFRTNTSLLAVLWSNSQCQNVIEEVLVEITLNETLVKEAVLSNIRYSTLTAQNYADFKQRFTINFKDSSEPSEEDKGRGYQSGDEIYAMKGEADTPFLFSMPKTGLCGTESGVPIKFLVNSNSMCTIRASQCREMQQTVRQLIDKFVPNWIQSVPTESVTNETNALVIRGNGTEVENPSGMFCPLTTELLIIIHYAKKGKEQNYRLVITSAKFAMNNHAVPMNSTAILRFSVVFKDSTPLIASRFVALPHIDLRLPNDFFYPFLERSAASAVTSIASSISVYLLLRN
ncbi:hypothetical protein GCK32_002730 [Trichostrongylus colubriformis]|uniref:Tectonic-1-3 domain-containing protein n=1 Tax=Trichostrongylus colubriformis TaxID=6319 RepID=A0AAN8FJI6_TRICO